MKNNSSLNKHIAFAARASFLFILSFFFLASFAQTFIHPGGLHKKSDLDRIKYMVQVGVQPWLSSYNTLNADSKSSASYTVQGDTTLKVITRDAPYTNLSKWYSDANAAYYNALMWAATSDSLHAKKCIEIFKAWSNLTQVTGGGTESLNGGLLGYLMIEAAEIIQSTYNWDATSKLKFKNMLVYPGYSNTTVPATLSATNGTFYWRIYMGDAGRHGNQDLAGIRTMLTMGVFLDNRIMYDRALRYYKGLTHRSDDLPYATGPSTNTTLVSSNSYNDSYNNNRGTTTADYGYNGVLTNYFWSSGQCQESSRDQGHTSLGGSLCQCISEIAWNQGDDVYSLTNNRLLYGLNYMTKYNVSYIASYADQLIPWEPTVASGEYIQGWDRTMRWYSKRVNPWTDTDTTRLSRGFNMIIPPVWEMAVAHYGVRQGLASDSVKWITRARDKAIDSVGYESHAPGTSDADHPGYGALTCRRPSSCAGDPISGFSSGIPVFAMNVLPKTIEAENFDYYTGSGEGHSYHDLSAGNSGGQYRTDADVDIKVCSEGGYNITNMEGGEWLTYTVFVPTTGNYSLKIRYATANTRGKIRFAFNDTDKTTDVSIPFGLPYSASLTDWKDFLVAASVPLTAGVQSMRIYVSGTSGSFELNKITIGNAVTATTTTINPVADSYVQDGTNADVNYGTATSIVTKASPAGNGYREGYLRFDITSIPTTMASAKLRLYAKSLESNSTRAIYAVATDTWGETTITYNNKPAYTTQLALDSITGTGWYEFDITSYVLSEFAGNKLVSICIKDPIANNAIGTDFYSKENSTNKPQLVILSTATGSLAIKQPLIKRINEESATPQAFQAYPNPTTNTLQIQYNGKLQNDAIVNIYTTSGQLIRTKKITDTGISISMKDLSKGNYLVEVKNGAEKSIKNIVKM